MAEVKISNVKIAPPKEIQRTRLSQNYKTASGRARRFDRFVMPCFIALAGVHGSHARMQAHGGNLSQTYSR